VLSGLPARTGRQRERVAAWFHAQGVRRLALSLGGEGLRLSEAGGGVCERPVWPVAVRNVTGAGDALMAALVHAQLAGWPLQRAADFALGCGCARPARHARSGADGCWYPPRPSAPRSRVPCRPCAAAAVAPLLDRTFDHRR
jgi:sugar/nucleoside kinase (ribokinase family)